MATYPAFLPPPFKLFAEDQKPDIENGARDIRSVLDLVTFNEIHNPQHTFCVQDIKGHDTPCRITFQKLARVVDGCLSWLLELQSSPKVLPLQNGSFRKSFPVALFMGSDIGIFIYILALMKLGIPVALFSARLTPVAVAHLLRQTSAAFIIVTSHTANSAKEAVQLLLVEDGRAIETVQAQDVEDLLRIHSPSKEVADKGSPLIEDNDRRAIVLHSSGTTGLPKPIFHTHKYLLGYAACHRFPPDSEVGKVCVSTLPLFHGFGLLAPCLSLAIGKPFALPSSSIIPAAGSTISLIQRAGATSLMTVPSILEELLHYPEGRGVEALLQMSFVACGGGPMKASVAEELSAKGVRLLNHCGATEIGAIAPIFNPGPEYDWRYFVLRDDIGLRVESTGVEDGDEGHSGCVKLIGRPFGWDQDFAVQDFLRPNPIAPTAQFQFLGRADDLIVLANGEKIRATALEETVSNDCRVKDAIVFGESREHLVLLVEAAVNITLDLTNSDEVSAYIDTIWATIQAGNELVDKHGKISKEMVIVTTPSIKPLTRTSKGSVARKETYDVFSTEIDAAYRSSMVTAVDPFPDLCETNQVTAYIREVVHRIFRSSQDSAPIRDDDDFFEAGMDSLQATMLHRILLTSLSQRANLEMKSARIGKEFVYANSTINRIAIALSSQIEAEPSISNDSNSRLMLMKEMVAKFSKVLEARELNKVTSGYMNGHTSGRMNEWADEHIEGHAKGHRDNLTDGGLDGYMNRQKDGDAYSIATGYPPSKSSARRPHEKVVLLTGSTGNLGSSMLYHLATDHTVSKILCLNRKATWNSLRTDCQSRQKAVNEKMGLSLPDPANKKIQLLEVDYALPEFGLTADQMADVTEASYIIHNAWPMDFNRSLISFEAHFQALSSIISLGLRCDTPPRILFTSSIATVARYGTVTGNPSVPEQPMLDPNVTAHFGYPEAKWVCEQLLQHAAIAFPNKFEQLGIVRIGQLTGSSRSGAWSSTEHLPSIFRSSVTLGALPDLPKTFSWLPVDIAAKAMTQLLFHRHTDPGSHGHPTSPLSIFHLENPHRQPWSQMLPILAHTLISPAPSPLPDSTTQPPHPDPLRIIPFSDWLSLVRSHPSSDSAINPAKRLEQFLTHEFSALGAGEVVLKMEAAREAAPALEEAGPVGEELVRKYVAYWRTVGLL